MGVVLVAVLAIGLVYRLVNRIGFDRLFNRWVATLLWIVGIVMWLIGLLPLLALVLITFGIVQFVRLTVKRRWPGTASLAPAQ